MQVGDLVKYKNGEYSCGLVTVMYMRERTSQGELFDAAEVLWRKESIARLEYVDKLEVISKYRKK